MTALAPTVESFFTGCLTALTWGDLSWHGPALMSSGTARDARNASPRSGRPASPDCSSGSARTPPNPVASCSPPAAPPGR